MTTQFKYTDKVVAVNGLKLHYQDWGDPALPPVIALHGFRGHSHSWDSFCEPMSSRCRLIALDQRGRGDSDWAPDKDYTSDAYVKDLEGFCLAMDLDRVTLVGHSMGGRNALLFAGRHPSMVSKLVVVDVGPESDPQSRVRIKADIMESPEEYDSLEDLLQIQQKKWAFISPEVLRRRLVYETKDLPNGKLGWRYDTEIRQQWREDRLPPSEDSWPVIARIPCPTLIVRADETDTLPLPVAQRMTEVMPQARLEHVEQATHMVMEDNPQGFLRVVQDFLGPSGES